MEYKKIKKWGLLNCNNTILVVSSNQVVEQTAQMKLCLAPSQLERIVCENIF